MKILYVLVSSEADYYYEQALISMMSAKHQMPNCFISLLTDRETDNSLKESRNLINEYVSEKKVIDLDKSLSPMQKSRWLKTSMRNFIEGDFLYVDVDTVFSGEIDKKLFTDDIMGVPDGNCPLKSHPMKWFIESNLKQANFDNSLKYHINSGVLFFKDTPLAHSFANHWHKRWIETCKKNIYIDQTALHQAIIDSGNVLKILPSCINAQFGRNLNTLANGIILHYYSSWAENPTYVPAYKLLQKDFLKNVRLNPKSESVQHIIRHPKEAFDMNTLILGEKISLFWSSQWIQRMMYMKVSKDHADIRLSHFLEKQNMMISNLYYKIIKLLYPLKKALKKRL